MHVVPDYLGLQLLEGGFRRPEPPAVMEVGAHLSHDVGVLSPPLPNKDLRLRVAPPCCLCCCSDSRRGAAAAAARATPLLSLLLCIATLLPPLPPLPLLVVLLLC